jgi:hypothetical protein
MAKMQQVKTAIGENDFFTRLPYGLNTLAGLIQ